MTVTGIVDTVSMRVGGNGVTVYGLRARRTVTVSRITGRVDVGSERCRLFATNSAGVTLATDELVAHVGHIERRATVTYAIDRTNNPKQI